MSDSDKLPVVPEVLVDDLQEVVDTKKRLSSNNLSPAKFAKLVGKEYTSIGKCNRILRKITKLVESDEYIFSLEPKDLIKLMDSVTRMKYASFGLLTKLYEVCTKNEILRTYFEDKQESRVETMKQDAKIKDIVSKLKAKAKAMEERNDLPE